MSLKNEANNRRAAPRATGRWSISRRLTLLYAVSSFVMLSLATAYLYWSLSENLEREDIAFLANEIQECRTIVRERPDDMQLLAHEIQSEAATSQSFKYYIRLLDENGQLRLDTP